MAALCLQLVYSQNMLSLALACFECLRIAASTGGAVSALSSVLPPEPSQAKPRFSLALFSSLHDGRMKRAKERSDVGAVDVDVDDDDDELRSFGLVLRVCDRLVQSMELGVC